MYRNNPITAVLYSKQMCSCAMSASHCVLAYIICVCTCAVYSHKRASVTSCSRFFQY